MNGIIGLSELALNLPMSAELRDYLSKISASSQSLIGILNDILDFSKLEAKGIVIEAIPFDLDALLQALAGLMEQGARQFKFVDRTFNLKVDTSARILQFFLDRIQRDGHAVFLHFELVPDHLPERLRQLVAQQCRFVPASRFRHGAA